MGVGFCFFLLIAIWCSTGNLKDREPLSQSLSDFKLHFCQEKKGGSAVREREKIKKSVRDDTPLCSSVCFEKASQQNYGSKRLTAAIKNSGSLLLSWLRLFDKGKLLCQPLGRDLPGRLLCRAEPLHESAADLVVNLNHNSPNAQQDGNSTTTTTTQQHLSPPFLSGVFYSANANATPPGGCRQLRLDV